MRKLLFCLVILCLWLSTLLVLRPSTLATADGLSIVGTWLVTTTPDVPPGTLPFSYAELVSLNPGGTLVDTHAIAHGAELAFLPPAVAVDSSDAFGIWQQAGTNQIATTHKRLLFAGPNTPPALYGPSLPGQHVGFESVQTMLTIQWDADGETLSGPFAVQFANLSGQVVFADSGTVVFKRLKLQRLAAP
jgi:hypothetical protein